MVLVGAGLVTVGFVSRGGVVVVGSIDGVGVAVAAATAREEENCLAIMRAETLRSLRSLVALR
jgi:hypothetical protein